MSSKPAGVTWESFTERRIREATEAGVFDQLPGFGKPIPGIDEPIDENWWIRRKLRDEGVNVVPPVLEARLDVEKTLNAIAAMTLESDVRSALERLNARIRAAQLSPAAGPSDGVAGVDIDEVVQQWRARSDVAGEGYE